jgi:hypothetical protein
VAQLPDDMIAGCEILSEMSTGSCIDLTPRKDIRGCVLITENNFTKLPALAE